MEILDKNKIGKQKKPRMFNAYIAPILLYNCGTWALTKTIEDRFNSFHRRLLRRIIGVFWPKKMTNEDLYLTTKQQELSKAISFKRLTFLGHILKLGLSTSAQKAMEKYFDASYISTKGKPKTTLASVLKHDFKYTKITLNNREDLVKLRMLAADRKKWKKQINN